MSQVALALTWWLVLQLFGLAVLPLALRVFRQTPSAGWAFARPLGLLLVGYLFWLGATFGVLANTWASILGALVIVASIAWGACWREAVTLLDFVRAHRPLVVAVEAIFTGAFVLWTIVRAYNPEISATEKPMELAFLNGVLRSEQFPPLDPWLSGYAISYYYFGYVLVAMVARFAGAPGHYAFNLALPTLFALTATGAFAIGAALHGEAVKRALRGGFLAILLVLCLTNLEPVLEILNAQQMLSPETRAYFAIKDMPNAYQSRSLFPTDPPDGWWWFRATRVIGTVAPEGSRGGDYTINEFPFFSFILGDMHPHVLALPFVLLAIAYALELLRAPGRLALAELRRHPWTLAMVGVVFGGLGFLNAWDMPTFLFLLAGAFAIHRLLDTGQLTRPLVREVVYGFVGALGLALLLYLPFYLVFRSQASGFGVPLVHTQLRHFLLFWGPLYLLVGTFLVHALIVSWRPGPADWTRGPFTWGATAIVAIVGVLLETPVVAATAPLLVAALALGTRYLLAPAVAPVPVVAADAPAPGPTVRRRRAAPKAPAEIAGGALPLVWPREHLFAVLMAFTGLLLLLGCELIFVRDLFNNRMNTVFKLYYQAWILLALAGAYALPYLVRHLGRPVAGQLWLAVLGLVIGLALLYPFGATLSKTRDFAGPPTLDGLAFWDRARPDDMDAIEWLRENVTGAPVVVEASGPSYQQQFGRISSMTGLPTLLGWPFHEQQWRGSFEEQGRRQPDIDAIYGCRRAAANRCEPIPPDPRALQALLDKYNVGYVVVGPSEREAYGQINLERFAAVMDVAYRNPQVVIYRTRGRAP